MAIETRSREEHSVRKITSGDYHLTDFRNKEAEMDDYGEWSRFNVAYEFVYEGFYWLLYDLGQVGRCGHPILSPLT